jgi:hypothetical protein
MPTANHKPPPPFCAHDIVNFAGRFRLGPQFWGTAFSEAALVLASTELAQVSDRLLEGLAATVGGHSHIGRAARAEVARRSMLEAA